MLPSDETGPVRKQEAEGTWQDRKIQYIPGRIIVKLKAPESDADVAAMVDRAESVAAQLGGRPVRPPSATGRVVIQLDESADSLEVAAKMAAELGDDVEYVEPDVLDHAVLVPNDTRYTQQWAPPLVRAEDAWDVQTGTTSVVIGIIDSGISTDAAGALDHPDLMGSRFTLGTDFVDGGAPRDLHGHGTHVAGIAAARGNNASGIAGMNWGSRVYICRTLDVNGSGSSADFADAVEEITDFAVTNNLKAVINYSGGGAANQTKLDACNYASSHGMILCAATGNDFAGPVIWPAAYSTVVPGVIAVGSTTSTDAVSNFSNVGPEVTVVAPGTGILSTMPTYSVTLAAGLNFGTLNGTSMATPLVTGLVGLMWSKNPGQTNAAIKQCLIDTAVKLGAGTFDNAWGNGRVDARAALDCVPARITVRSVIVCPPISRITDCTVKSFLCPPESRITLCRPPSRLPVLCQVSKLPILCSVKSSIEICVSVSSLRCPSAIDACPSALDPNCGGTINSGIACVETNIRGIETVINPNVRVGPRMTANVSAGGTGMPQSPAGTGGGMFWIDDNGRYRNWNAEADAGAEVWYDAGGQYYWIDDEGQYQSWPKGGPAGEKNESG